MGIAERSGRQIPIAYRDKTISGKFHSQLVYQSFFHSPPIGAILITFAPRMLSGLILWLAAPFLAKFIIPNEVDEKLSSINFSIQEAQILGIKLIGLLTLVNGISPFFFNLAALIFDDGSLTNLHAISFATMSINLLIGIYLTFSANNFSSLIDRFSFKNSKNCLQREFEK